MNNTGKITIGIWLLWVVVTSILVTVLWDSGYREFKGREIFYSDDEYADFKKSLVTSDLKILSMIALSSEPPIIVDFRIETRNLELDFPYGGSSIDKDWTYVFIGAAIPIVATVALWPYTRSWGEKKR